MSFMSVPALDRLLEPLEAEGSSWRSRAAMNMPLLVPAQTSSSLPPFSPSPYVLNFKRRVFDGDGVVEAPASSFRGETEVVSEGRREVMAGVHEDGMLPVREVSERGGLGDLRRKSEEKLVKAEEGTSVGRRQQEASRGTRSRNSSIGQQDVDLLSISSSTREEFFDAPDQPFEDTASDEEGLRAQRTPRSMPGSRRDVDGYLKLQLDQEIKRRMAAEDAMAVLQLQCTDMASHLASVDNESRGLGDSGSNDWDGGSQTQQLVVAQVVAYSVARGAARAEVGEAMENVVAEKNREISRLRDKLHYYELVNHEMSQRNQEAFELARSRRHGRRNRNQWLMVCAGSALCVGVSALLVSKFAPWAASHFPAESVLQSHLRTDVHHSSPSHDI